MKTLLVLENDPKFPDCIERFIRSYRDLNPDSILIRFNYLRLKTDDEIYEALEKATDLAFQTQFIDGSEHQVAEIFQWVLKMDSKNFYINNYDLQVHMEKCLEDKGLYDSQHHKIYKIYSGMIEESELLDFSPCIQRHQNVLDEAKIKAEELAADKKVAKPTGIKVKILACNTGGKEFSQLPIGSIVDTLDCIKFNPNPSRGVWVKGLTEPVKLINDCGLQEYKIVSELSFKEKLNHSFKQTNINPDNFSDVELRGLLSIFEDDDYSALEKAQEFCDFVGIERRGNRRNLANLIESC